MDQTGLHFGHGRALPPSRQGRSGEILANDLRINLDTMAASVAGQDLDLTVQEYDLLVLLAEEAGRPVPQQRLAISLWQDPKSQHAKHLSVLVSRLRTKLAASKEFRLETLRKRGYGLMPLITNEP